MAAPRPFVPRPPQMAEAHDLLVKLQEIEQFLRSTAPDSPQLRPLGLQIQKLTLKLKQVQQRVNLYGFSEPVLPRAPQAPNIDMRPPEHIGVLTAELGLQAQGPRLSSGPEVAVLRELLRFCGAGLEAGDTFDQDTLNALRNFQKQQGLPVSGRVDDKTRPRLNACLRLLRLGQQSVQRSEHALAHWQMQVGENLPDITRHKLHQILWQRVRLLLQGRPQAAVSTAAAEISAPPPAPPAMPALVSRLGTGGQAGLVSRGPEVDTLQRLLQQAGYALVANGHFDLQTFTALKAFQQDRDLAPSGETDPASLAQLNRLLEREHSDQRLQQALFQAHLQLLNTLGWDLPAPAAAEAQELLDAFLHLLRHPEQARWPGWSATQQLTQELGLPPRQAEGPEVLLLQELLDQLQTAPADSGSPRFSGIFDSLTQQAVRQFQSQHKLPASGWLDAATRSALNHSLTALRSRTL